LELEELTTGEEEDEGLELSIGKKRSHAPLSS
jgi:hypothetical protein